jgi:hypothetical protein
MGKAMKKILFAFFLCGASLAYGQAINNFNLPSIGVIKPQNICGGATNADATHFCRGDGAWVVPPGGSATPGGSTGQVQYNNAGAFAAVTNMSGDCTWAIPSGVITCLKTNGTSFAPSATIDTTNAANITSGTLAAARGGAGTTSGILKANGSGLVSAATSGTDYAPATSGSSILYGNGAGGFSNVTIGSGLTFSTGTLSATGGGGGTPGGTSGQVQYNNAGALGGFTVSGDATLNTGTGALTVTKTNGVAFGTAATKNLTYSGNTTTAISTTGVLNSGDAVKIDASGNVIDAGGPQVATGGLTDGDVCKYTAAGPTIDCTGPVSANIVTASGTLTSGQLLAGGGTKTAAVTNLTGDVTTSGSVATTIAPNAVTSSKMAVVNTRRVCNIAIGDTSGVALTNAQLGPQSRICYIPAAATIVEIDVAADASTPNLIIGRNHAGTVVNLVSSALATAASGGIACSNTGGTTGIDGVTTCSATLQNTSLSAGDYVELVSGTAGGTAKLMTAHIIYTIN